jgi:hypothetical protein
LVGELTAQPDVLAVELVEELSVASHDNELADALGQYVSPQVLIDEVGYSHRSMISPPTSTRTARRRPRRGDRRPGTRARSSAAARRALDAESLPVARTSGPTPVEPAA